MGPGGGGGEGGRMRESGEHGRRMPEALFPGHAPCGRCLFLRPGHGYVEVETNEDNTKEEKGSDDDGHRSLTINSNTN